MFRVIGSLFIVPTTVLLTLSFFVLVVNQKQEKILRIFGWVVAALLWLSAFMVFSAGNYMGSHGYHKMMGMRRSMMMEDCRMMKGTGAQGPMMQQGPMKKDMPMPMGSGGKMNMKHRPMRK